MATFMHAISQKKKVKQIRILVIDDQEDQWQLTRCALQQTIPTAQLHWSPSADEATRYVSEQLNMDWDYPQLILLDLYMPQPEQGWQVLKTIRELPVPFNQVPVIVFTNSDDGKEIHQSYQLGATSYLVKPLNFSHWLDYFSTVREYWLDTATLVPIRVAI